MRELIIEAIVKSGWTITDSPATDGFKPDLTVQANGMTCHFLSGNIDSKTIKNAVSSCEGDFLVVVKDASMDFYAKGSLLTMSSAMPSPEVLEKWVNISSKEKEGA